MLYVYDKHRNATLGQSGVVVSDDGDGVCIMSEDCIVTKHMAQQRLIDYRQPSNPP